MKAIVVMFDSLNRNFLPPYGGWAVAPNFQRLALRSATFDTAYVASMPCMPARRDMLTGRVNFLHRGWGPLEPFDECLPKMLEEGGIATHLITDHQHYWEEGGANYHTKFRTCELVRGQEGDPWIPSIREIEFPESAAPRRERKILQDHINRQKMDTPEKQPMSRVFAAAEDFLRENHDEDCWFLQVETFDPHEPFFTHQRYKDLYPEHYTSYRGKPFDWPPYRNVQETPDEVRHVRHEYASLVSMCDEKLGEILDLMDEYAMWDDTLLIVMTDHGFLLGEHDSWAKCWMPFFEEVARVPFFVWDPRARIQGQRRESLVQPALDLAPTVLNYFECPKGKHMLGCDLSPAILGDNPVRSTGIFGLFGAHVNITDGRYVYMRGNPEGQANEPLHAYTLQPSQMRSPYPLWMFSSPIESRTFSFTKGCHVMKLPAEGGMPGGEATQKTFATLLFDIERDPSQAEPLDEPRIEARMAEALEDHLLANDAPRQQWVRLGLDKASAGVRSSSGSDQDR